MAISENSIKVLNYLKDNHGKDMTAADVADALGLPKKTVDACFTSSIQRKEYGYREEAEIEVADGHKKAKFLKLNEQGLNYDPTASAA